MALLVVSPHGALELRLTVVRSHWNDRGEVRSRVQGGSWIHNFFWSSIKLLYRTPPLCVFKHLKVGAAINFYSSIKHAMYWVWHGNKDT